MESAFLLGQLCREEGIDSSMDLDAAISGKHLLADALRLERTADLRPLLCLLSERKIELTAVIAPSEQILSILL